jgi:hypothetical protein
VNDYRLCEPLVWSKNKSHPSLKNMVRVAVYTVNKNCKTCISFIYQEIQILCFSIVSNLFVITKLPHCEFESCSGDMYSIQDKVCQWLATGRWFSLSTLVFSTNKTDCHDITLILLKVVLNTITLTLLKPKKSNWYFLFLL